MHFFSSSFRINYNRVNFARVNGSTVKNPCNKLILMLISDLITFHTTGVVSKKPEASSDVVKLHCQCKQRRVSGTLYRKLRR